MICKKKDFIEFFKSKVILDDTNKSIVEKNYLNIITKLKKSRLIMSIKDNFIEIGFYLFVLLLISLPYIFMLIDLVTNSISVDNINNSTISLNTTIECTCNHLTAESFTKYTNTIAGLLIAIWKFVSHKILFNGKIFIYDQTIDRLEMEGIKFLESKDVQKFIKTIDKVINYTIVHYEKDIEYQDYTRDSFMKAPSGYKFFGLSRDSDFDKELIEKKKEIIIDEKKDTISIEIKNDITEKKDNNIIERKEEPIFKSRFIIRDIY